jgi:hypothetical protein
MKTQRIIFYSSLSYQLLGVDADIGTYHEFLSAFDDLARGQSFEKVYPSVPEMRRWMSDNGHKNDNAGRRAFSETLNALHPDIDHVPKKQSFAAANFGNILGSVNPWGSRINYAAMPHMDPFRK